MRVSSSSWATPASATGRRDDPRYLAMIEAEKRAGSRPTRSSATSTPSASSATAGRAGGRLETDYDRNGCSPARARACTRDRRALSQHGARAGAAFADEVSFGEGAAHRPLGNLDLELHADATSQAGSEPCSASTRRLPVDQGDRAQPARRALAVVSAVLVVMSRPRVDRSPAAAAARQASAILSSRRRRGALAASRTKSQFLASVSHEAAQCPCTSFSA